MNTKRIYENVHSRALNRRCTLHWSKMLHKLLRRTTCTVRRNHGDCARNLCRVSLLAPQIIHSVVVSVLYQLHTLRVNKQAPNTPTNRRQQRRSAHLRSRNAQNHIPAYTACTYSSSWLAYLHDIQTLSLHRRKKSKQKQTDCKTASQMDVVCWRLAP